MFQTCPAGEVYYGIEGECVPPTENPDCDEYEGGSSSTSSTTPTTTTEEETTTVAVCDVPGNGDPCQDDSITCGGSGNCQTFPLDGTCQEEYCQCVGGQAYQAVSIFFCELHLLSLWPSKLFFLVQECPPGFAYSEDVEDCDVYENIDDCDAEPPVTHDCSDTSITCTALNEGEFFAVDDCDVSIFDR